MKSNTVKFTLPYNGKTIEICDYMFNASHVLIGGTTGSGKSTLIEDFIYTVTRWFFPSETSINGAQFALIDPKRVALTEFKALPHTVAYACENKEIINLLNNIVTEMDLRYKDMAQRGIKEYDKGYLIVIIDELADLMTTCKKQVMPLLQRIAQLGRASRIKLVCATQCPKREVIPAQLTVNFDGRVGLRCNDRIESTQIVKKKGAETLPKYGKCIYLHNDGYYYELSIPKLSDNELRNHIAFWKNQTPLWWKPLEKKEKEKPLKRFWNKFNFHK